MDAKDIESAICRMYRWKAMIWLPQCRVGVGFGEDAERVMDLWGIQVSKPWTRVAIEIKVSRGDFRRDVANRLKQRRARLLVNEFYYAAPVGLLTPEDMPEWAGLIEVKSILGADFCAGIRFPAPWFDSSAPTWRFVAAIARRTNREAGVAV